MRWLRQTLAVMALNIRTIPARLGSSAVAIVGIAGVVVVFVSVLSIAAGFSAAMQGSGSPGSRARDAQRRRQRDDERPRRRRASTSSSRRPASRRDGQRPAGVRRALRDSRPAEEGRRLRRRTCRCAASSRPALELRSEASIIEGRMFTFGTNEVVVGRGAARPVRGHRASATRSCPARTGWQVVGMFEADGGVAETEDLVRRADAAGRVPPRQHVSVACSSQLESPGVVRRVPRLAHVEPAASTSRSAARTSTTPASRRR